MVDCEYCGREIGAENPVKSDEGEPICHDCYVRHFTFTCAICSNFIYDGERKGADPKKHFVVVSSEHNIDPGFYKITDKPYYVDNYFSQKVRKDNVEKIGELTEEPIAGEGYVCQECAEDAFENAEHSPVKVTTANA